MSDISSCKYCGSRDLVTDAKGNQLGLYCTVCGRWQKWLNKNEANIFKISQKNSIDIPNKDVKDVVREMTDFSYKGNVKQALDEIVNIKSYEKGMIVKAVENECSRAIDLAPNDIVVPLDVVLQLIENLI